MMDKAYIFLLMVLALTYTGCEADVSPTPVLPDSTVVRVLSDFHLLNARAELFHDVPPAFRDSIFLYHNVDSAAFRETMTFYVQHPEDYLKLYRKVLDHLNAEMVGRH